MMSLPARNHTFDALAFARQIVSAEAEALHTVAGRLDAGFTQVVEMVLACRGRVAVTGIGKSADVGQKIVGTLNSTGTRAYLLDATRAMHGDLGMVHPDDVAVLLSHSGESDELLRLIGPLRKLASAVVAVTGNANSTLGRSVDAVIAYGPIAEACPLSLAPSTSTTAMIALGDAVAFTLSERREFTAEQFATFHPAGSLGRQLAAVEDAMRQGKELRIAAASETVRAVFAQAKHEGRRTGAVILVDEAGRLTGLFTDSDLARLFENHADQSFDQPIATVMTRSPITVSRSTRLSEAIELMRARKISELPVIDEECRPVGMLDITDVIGLEPDDNRTRIRPVLRVIGPEAT